MADNVPITAGSGTSIATDDVASVHYQKVKLVTSEADSAEGIGDTDKGSTRALWVEPRRVVARQAQTPTVSTTPAYAAKDAVGGLITWTNVARISGGSVRIESVQLVDKGQQMAPLDLLLFDQSITAPTDNAIFAPTDAELANCVDVIPIGSYADQSTNSIAIAPVGRSVVLSGTSLFGVLVSRGTPTYVSTSDIVVTLTYVQD